MYLETRNDVGRVDLASLKGFEDRIGCGAEA